jgi:hypothetical protein
MRGQVQYCFIEKKLQCTPICGQTEKNSDWVSQIWYLGGATLHMMSQIWNRRCPGYESSSLLEARSSSPSCIEMSTPNPSLITVGFHFVVFIS